MPKTYKIQMSVKSGTHLLFFSCVSKIHKRMPRLIAVNIILQTQQTEPNLQRPSGIATQKCGQVLVANLTTNTITSFPSGLNIPITSPDDSSISAIVVNNNKRQFLTPTGVTTDFIVATQSGEIIFYNRELGQTTVVPASNAAYTGLAIDACNARLYAASIQPGKIDVYQSFGTSFVLLKSFTDEELNAQGFVPYDIAIIGDKIYAVFSQVGNGGFPLAGSGYLSVFDLEGNLLDRIASGAPLNGPISLTRAACNENLLYIANRGDGRVLVFSICSGQFVGALRDVNGAEIVIPGITSITFRDKKKQFYYTASTQNTNGTLGLLKLVK